MTIDPDTLLGWEFPVLEQAYDERDAILYALGVGLGTDPTDERQLRYLYEDGLRVFPTMGLVLGHPGPWYRDPRAGVDWVRVVHGEQELTVHAPLLPRDRIRCHTRVTGVVDKGPDRGALVFWQREVSRAGTGEPLCTLASTLVCRADGGFGGPAGPVRPRPTVPDGPAAQTCDLVTSPRAGLIYRLSGDLNPLHADPAVARAAGFDRPILHGLGTLGVAAHAVLRACLDYEPELRGLSARFSAPMFPGETVRTELWPLDDGVAFRCTSLERGAVVIDGGRAELGKVPA
ncbi:MaoC/PaaZ C-terminal domain-containing protein [Dactylosporangium sp. CS-033363]|uniref:MaoC/PaaZ C-terminal domain-containing protein n=1 Tax=Dactylosporangium sp. CS-033363 TaxID=3239935 RepID=UPI003D8B271C